MTRPDHEIVSITAALSRLAVCVRDTTVDAEVFTVYIEELDSYKAEDIVAACHWLQDGQWFPKLSELKSACAKAAHARHKAAREAHQQRFLVAHEPEISPQQHQELLARLRMATHERH